MTTVSMTVNGKAVSADVEPRTLLVDYLRENLRLTGTHVGCDTSQCGACTIHVDGIAIKSCTMLAVQAEGAAVLDLAEVLGLDAAGCPAPVPEGGRPPGFQGERLQWKVLRVRGIDQGWGRQCDLRGVGGGGNPAHEIHAREPGHQHRQTSAFDRPRVVFPTPTSHA